jgi:hypothetical protein
MFGTSESYTSELNTSAQEQKMVRRRMPKLSRRDAQKLAGLRFLKMTPDERVELARKAVTERWRLYNERRRIASESTSEPK